MNHILKVLAYSIYNTSIEMVGEHHTNEAPLFFEGNQNLVGKY